MIRVYGYCIVRLVLICRAASSAFWRQWHGGLRLLAFVGVLTPSSSFAFTDTNPVVFSNVPLGTCMVDVQYDPSFSLALVQVRNGLSVFTPEGTYFVFGSATPNGTTLTALGLSSCGVSDVVLSNVKGADAGLGYAGQTYMGFEATYTRDAAAYQFTATIREDTPGTVTATSSEVLIPSNPKVISIVRQTPTNQATNADTLTFRVSFDKNVQNVDTTDFAVTGSTASVTNVSLQSTSVYDVTVSGGDLANLNGSVSLGFAGGQNIVDFTSNAVVDTTPTGANESYALDNIAPSYTVSNFLQLTDGATPFTITFNFDEDVFGFSQSAVAALLLNATASDLSETVPNRQFSLKITPNGNGDVTLLNGATWIAGDLAGNQNSAGSQYISTLDSTAPSITSIVRHNPTSAVTDADTLTWRVTFNEIVQGVAGDLGLWEIVGTTGSVTAVSPVGNGFGYWQHFDVTVSGGDLAGLTGQQVALSLRPTVGASIRDVVGNTVANTTPTGAHETYTVTQDNVAPSVQILDVPANHDGETAFQITVEFSEDVTYGGGIDVSNGVPSGFNAIDANSYQFTITPSGFGDIELQVDAGAATDGAGNPNISSALVTVKSNLVEKTTLLIEDFLGSRSRSILQQRPDLIGFLDGTFERVSPKAGNLQSYFSATEDGMNGEFAFSTSLNQLRQLGLDQDGLSMGLNGETQSPTKKGSFDVWTEVHGALSKTAQNSADNLVATFGGHYFVTPDLLIGGTVQLDWASQRDLGNANSIGGRGWMAGPYLAAKLPDQNIYFEAGALWGKSDNWVSPVGTFTDNFTTERWMAHAKIAGEIEVGNLTIVPEASYSHFDETQHAYTDSLSNPIASQHLTLGELNIGPKFTWTVDLDDGSRFVPSVGLSSITSFGTNAGTRGKLLFGFEHKNALGWALSADGYYDGIGQQGFDAVGGNIKLNVPLN